MEPFADDAGPTEPVALPSATLLDQVRDHAIFLIDRRGRLATWNAGVQAVMGWREDAWIGQPLQVAFTPEDVAAGVPQAELATAAQTGRADDDRWMQRRDGTRFFAVGSLTRIVHEDGRLAGFLKILRDATALHEIRAQHDDLLKAEQAARADAERHAATLTAAIDAIPAGVYFGNAGGITRCNRPALDMLGLTSVEELRANVDELGDRFNVRLERDGPPLEPALLPFARALQGETAVLDTWATKADGEDVLIRGSAAPIVVDGQIVGAVAVNTDLTARLQLEQQRHQLLRIEAALEERDAQLRALTEGVRDYAIFTIDLQGCIASWHEGAALMKGYSAEQAIGMPFEQLFTPDDRAAGRPAFEMSFAARRGEYQGEGRRLRRDGTTFEAAVVLTALRDAKGELLGYLKLTQDISRRKQLEREREEMLRQAQRARADAERASAAKGLFLATISHELRTPLSAILGWAHVLERNGSEATTMRQGLAAISRNARVQVRLIEDLLDMNRIESGQIRLEMQPVDLGGVIAGAVESMLPAAQAAGVHVLSVLDPAAGTVVGDPARLQQIVWNLLSNAVKFTPPAGQVTVATRAAGERVQVIVEDTGQGIERDFLDRVFDRFQQQEGTTTRRHGGLGLGLAIVRELVQLHRGSVTAYSDGLGQGARFEVTLPARPQPAAALPSRVAPVAAASLSGASAPLAASTVLLVDDEPDVLAVTAHMLREAGARVMVASSADEAFDMFRRDRPQVLVSDVGMPVHDGIDLIRRIRALAPTEGGDVPAAAFTAYARPEDRRRALDAGFQDYLVKPIAPATLVQAVATLLHTATGSGR